MYITNILNFPFMELQCNIEFFLGKMKRQVNEGQIFKLEQLKTFYYLRLGMKLLSK